MDQGSVAVPLRGRKRAWYLMKGCMKDFLNLLDTSRERVAFLIFCVLLFFSKKLLWHGNEADFKTMILSAFFIYYIKNYNILQDTAFLSTFVKKLNFISWFEHKKLDCCHTMPSCVSSKMAAWLHCKYCKFSSNFHTLDAFFSSKIN